MRDTDLFQLALALVPPWLVARSDFDAAARRLDIHIDFAKGGRFACPSCGAGDCPAYDTEELTWRHLNFFQHQAYLHARVPRVRCDSCGIMALVSAMPVKTVARVTLSQHIDVIRPASTPFASSAMRFKHGTPGVVEGRESLQKINRDFGNSSNVIKKIRHEFAFHFETTEIDAIYDQLPQNGGLPEYWGAEYAYAWYNLFCGAEIITLMAMVSAEKNT